MAWTNLKSYDPGATLAVYKNGVLVDPNDYAAEGVAIAWVGEAVELTYPPGELDAYLAMAVASAPPLDFLARHIDISHTAWLGEGALYYLTTGNALVDDSNLSVAATLQEFNNVGDGNPYNGIGIVTPNGQGA